MKRQLENKYDFLLIEPLYWKRAHYEIDQKNLAEILTEAGYKTAVIDYLKVSQYHKNRIYDVINFDLTVPKRKKNSFPIIGEIIFDLRFLFKFKKILKFKEKCDFRSLYLGTLSLQSVFLFSKKFKEKNIFFWGIRSSILTDGHYNNRNFFKLLKLYKLRKSIKKFNVLFFISNELIKNEFLDLGFLRKELILRPERTIKKLKIIEKKGSHFSLLSIGTIRKDKNIIFASKAAYKTKTNLIIAGRSSDDTARKWDKKISDRYWQYVKRINRFLDEDEYFNLVENTNYILITSLRTNSVRSNGTFIEAILYSTPVILPNYPPFDYYNKKYNVGLLYNSGDEDSLIEAIERAKKIKYEYFIPGIKKFQKDMLLENVAKKVKKQLTNI